MGIRDRNADAEPERDEAVADVAQYEDIHGVPTEEQALASVATHDPDGNELSEGQREQTAAKIVEAAQCNASWRQTLPYEQQMALIGVPVVSAPPIEADGAAV